MPPRQQYRPSAEQPYHPSFWFKIALLGSVLTAVPFVVLQKIIGDTGPWGVFGLLFTGILPVAIIVAVLSVFFISTHVLRRLGLRRPTLATALAIFLIVPILAALMSVFSTVLAYIPVVGTFLPFLAGGALGFVLAVYVVEKAKPVQAGAILVSLIVVPGLLVVVVGGIAKHYDTSGIQTTTPQTVEWSVLPAPLPANVLDADDGQSDNRCKNSFTYFAYYECRYSFSYPGYLSAESQAVIDSAVTNDTLSSAAALAPEIAVTVARDDITLDEYKYADGRCSIDQLLAASTAKRKRDYGVADPLEAKFQTCGSITTLGGKTLYYDSSHFTNTDVYAPIPYKFYFEQGDALVFIRVGVSAPQVDTYGAIYYTEPGYQSEISAFVDSFQ